MTIFFQRGGTAVNIDSQVPKPSQTNGTAARKFFAPDQEQTQDDRDTVVKTNDEHLVEQAASVKGASQVADSVASMARDALAAARAAVAQTQGTAKSDSRPVFSAVTVSDVDAQRGLSAKQAAAGVSSGGLFDELETAKDIYTSIPENVLKVKDTQPAPSDFNGVIPDLASVSVDMDPRKGSVDCFFSRLVISLPADQVQNVRLLRVFRAEVLSPIFQRGFATLSMQGVSRLTTSRLRSRIKNPDAVSQTDQRFAEAGIPTSISSLNPIDPTTNLRTAASLTNSKASIPNPVPDALIAGSPAQVASAGFVNSPETDGLDASVATDLNVLKNLRIQNPASTKVSVSAAAVVGSTVTTRPGLLNVAQVHGIMPDATPSLTVNGNNALGFREIAGFTLDRLQSRAVGDQVEYTMLDDQISYGRGYKYYVVSTDKNMIDSLRSSIVEITVEGIRVPEMPREVVAHTIDGTVILNAFVADQLVEKFEIWRKETNLALAKKQVVAARTFSSLSGHNVILTAAQRLDNGFVRIGESLNGLQTAGSMYRDLDVVLGRGYSYRIFSVDVFGNKSERPFELQVYVPDPSSRPNSLVKPHISAQVDAATNLMRLRFSCSDQRVTALFLSRRDLTIGQEAFSTPSGVNHIRLGRPKNAEGPTSFEGEVLRGVGPDISWTGMFPNSLNDTVFIDKTVSLDHVYQYKIYGVDRYGNRTSDDVTPPTMVVRRPMVDAPVNLTASVIAGPGSTVGGINLVWQEGNISIAAEDYLGSQASLRDTSLRILYQVERRKVGEERWVQFPLVPDRQFFDASPSVLGSQVPGFRPDLVEVNQTYVYRVQAVQTGAFVSNYSDPVQVFASLPLLAPENFRLRSSDANVSPAYVALNWDTPSNSATVDRWEIERSVVNNLAAAKMNPKSSADFQGLSFSAFRTVHLESSRFRSQILDDVRDRLIPSSTPSTVFTGEHCFQDMQVTLGNTYFYRIRAVGIDGTASAWAYRGMKLTDSSFEKKLTSLTDPTSRQVLSSNPVPLIVTGLSPISSGMKSFALQPAFSVPSTVPQVNVGVDTQTSNPGGSAAPSSTPASSPKKGLTGF